MKKYRTLLSLVLLGAFCFSVEAKSISFQVVQHDVGQTKIRNSSYELESSIMEYFFDRGYIVTNSITAMSNSQEDDVTLYHKSINEALNGNCEYFISLITEYKPQPSLNPEACLLNDIKGISWEVVDLHSGNVLFNGNKEVGIVSLEENTQQGVDDFAKYVASLIDYDLRNE